MKFSRIPVALVIAASCSLASGARAADGVDDVALYKKAVKSCVYIVVPSKGGIGQGSGSLIDVEKKLVVTNYHVVDDREVVFVQFPIFKEGGEFVTNKELYKANVPAGKAIKGKVLHRDKSRDLAFIELEKVPPGTPALPLAKRSIGVAAPVWNIGNPGAVDQVFSVTEGKVRGVGFEKLDFGDQVVEAKMVTTTNPANPGDSGGPLIDKRGFQVAVAQSINTKAQLVSSFVDITEVHAYLSEKKIVIKDLSNEANSPEVDSETIYRKAVGSCVYIVVPGVGSGSGSLIDADSKMVLTNWHVVEDNNEVFVQFPMYKKDGSIDTDKNKYKDNIPAGKAIKAKVMYRDKSRDLALVQLDRVPLGTVAIPLAMGSVKTGATTWNIGSPGAVAQVFSITEGKVRSLGVETIDFGDQLVKARLVTTTNPGNPGDSGGPLIDKRGFQVGVTQSGRTDAQLVGKFVDISEVRAFLTEKRISIKETGDAVIKKADPKIVTPPITKDGSGAAVPPETPNGTGSTATAAQEREASDLLRRSKLFATGEDNRPIYIGKLNDIIKKYPGTTAAKDAKKILADLK